MRRFIGLAVLTTLTTVGLVGIVAPPAHAAYADVTTFAGDGTATRRDSDRYNHPTSTAVDLQGNVYVADFGNNRIRKITPDGIATTIGGDGMPGYSDVGLGEFNAPYGVAVDQNQNVYVADSGNNRIRRITPAGLVSTIAGDGVAGFSDFGLGRFNYPEGVAVSNAGVVYVADTFNHRIRTVTGATVATIGGDGIPGDSCGLFCARFNTPIAIAVDSNSVLYVADYGNNAIRSKVPGNFWFFKAGSHTGLAGFSDVGDGLLNGPAGITTSADGVDLYIGDFGNHRIRHLHAGSWVPGFGDGTPGYSNIAPGRFNNPQGVALDTGGNVVVADWGNHLIRRISAAGSISDVSGDGAAGLDNGPGSFPDPQSIAVDATGRLRVLDGSGSLRIVGPTGQVTTMSTPLGFTTGSVAMVGGAEVVADFNHHVIRQLQGNSWVVIAGSGTAGFAEGVGSAIQFAYPAGVASDSNGNLYVSDAANSRIRKLHYNGSGWQSSTIGGDGTQGNSDAGVGRFNNPTAIAVDTGGNVYIADTNNSSVRKISATGAVSTIASSGSGGLNLPYGIAVDGGSNVYVASTYQSRIVRISAGGLISNVAGDGVDGYGDGNGTGARFDHPTGLAVRGTNLYVADRWNRRIRKIDVAVPTDTTPPTATMTSPTPGEVLSGAPLMAGTASDDVGVASVSVAIYRNVAGGQYWNGSGWQAGNTSVPAVLDNPGAPSTNWHYYTGPGSGVLAAAAVVVDTSGNYSVVPYRTYSITDTVNPTVGLMSPVNQQAFPGRPVVIDGGASDNAGVGDVQIAIYRPVDPAGQFWNGSAWQTAYTTVTATLSDPGSTSTGFTYSFNPPQSGGLFYAAAIALDTSYHYSLTSFVPFTLPDPTPPAAVLTSPLNGATTTGTVSIAGTATDNVSVNQLGVAIYRASTGQFYNGSGWQAGFATIPAVLSTPGQPSTGFTAVFTPPAPGFYLIAALPVDGRYNYSLTSFNTVNVT